MPPRKKTNTTKTKAATAVSKNEEQPAPVVEKVEQTQADEVMSIVAVEKEEPQIAPTEKATPAVAEAVTARPIPQIKEQYDLNLVIAIGVVRSVWGNNGDVFARLAVSHREKLVENDDKFTSHVTLRFADGMVGSSPITIQSGDVLKVQGYLVHREYTESLRKFLDEASSMNFFDQVDPADLSAWRNLALKRQNGILNVLSMSLLGQHGALQAHFGEPIPDKDQKVNRANLEGIVARVWEYRHNEEIDLFARIAVYDQHTPFDSKRDGNFGRQRRMAHYATLRFPCGKTTSGSCVRLKPKERIRVVGQLRDKMQVVTLRDELLRTGSPAVAEMMQRVRDAERLSEIKNQQESLHILADAVVVYSAGRHK